MSRSPVMLAIATVAVLIYGLGRVAASSLRVAPASGGDTVAASGHLTNVTRLGGTPSEVGALVHRASLGRDPVEPLHRDWRETIAAELQVDPLASHVVALPAEGADAGIWALPGAFWAVYAGAPVIFVGREHASPTALMTAATLRRPVYVLAPSSLVSDRARRELARAAAPLPVHRVAGRTPADHAVQIAEAHDASTGFGWGRTAEYRGGSYAFAVTTPREAAHGFAALRLATSAATTLLYAGDDGGVPAELDRYVWGQRPVQAPGTGLGPLRHFWVIGNRLSWTAQTRLEHATRLSPYLGRGPTALGPLDALAVVWLAFGAAGAVFVLLHGRRVLPEVSLADRTAWALTALLLPVLGVVLYVRAHRRPMAGTAAAGVVWRRSASLHAAAATVPTFGYGAALFVAVAWILTSTGMPIAVGPAGSALGLAVSSSATRIMITALGLATLGAWALAAVPIARAAPPPALVTLRAAAQRTAFGMLCVGVGMLPALAWLQHRYLPAPPSGHDVLWFGTAWAAAAAGFLVAWPLHRPKRRRGPG